MTSHRTGDHRTSTATAGNVWILHFRRRAQPVRAARCALAQR
jgi:hypothetical protein